MGINFGGGLNKWIIEMTCVQLNLFYIKMILNDSNRLDNNNIATMFNDINNIMWVGTWGDGLNKTVIKQRIIFTFIYFISAQK